MISLHRAEHFAISLAPNYSAPKIFPYKCAEFWSFESQSCCCCDRSIQSVKGKVVIDAFRLINPQTMMLGQEPRQTTSNVGHLNKPSIQVNINNIGLIWIWFVCFLQIIWSYLSFFFRLLSMGWTDTTTQLQSITGKTSSRRKCCWTCTKRNGLMD